MSSAPPSEESVFNQPIAGQLAGVGPRVAEKLAARGLLTGVTCTQWQQRARRCVYRPAITLLPLCAGTGGGIARTLLTSQATFSVLP